MNIPEIQTNVPRSAMEWDAIGDGFRELAETVAKTTEGKAMAEAIALACYEQAERALTAALN